MFTWQNKIQNIKNTKHKYVLTASNHMKQPGCYYTDLYDSKIRWSICNSSVSYKWIKCGTCMGKLNFLTYIVGIR